MIIRMILAFLSTIYRATVLVFIFILFGCVYDGRTEEEMRKDRIEAEKLELQLRTDREKQDWKAYKEQWDGSPPMRSVPNFK